MTSRPDLLKTMDANSFPYELNTDEPFVPPIDYPVGDLWLKQNRRPPTPPTDYDWDQPYPFVSYGGQQNFHGNTQEPKPIPEPDVDYLDVEPVKRDPRTNTVPPVDYLDVEPVKYVKRREPQMVKDVEPEKRHKKRPVQLEADSPRLRREYTTPDNRQWYYHQHKQFGNQFSNNCADCPICKAMAAAEGALAPQFQVQAQHQIPTQQQIKPQYQFQSLTPAVQSTMLPRSPPNKGIKGVPIFPPTNTTSVQGYKTFTDPPPQPQRRISFEEDIVNRERYSSESDLDDQDRINGVAYQKERRQLAYIEDMSSRRAFMARALMDRVARVPQELTVFKGEVVEVLNDQKSWWKCCNVAGQTGYVPFNLLKPVKKSEVKPQTTDRTPVPDYGRRWR